MTTKYEKLPLESLSDEQLDTFLDYLDQPFDELQKDQLKKRINQEKQIKKVSFFRKKKRLLMIVAAAASLLLMTAFTQRDELRLLYLKYFGTESQILLSNSDRLDFEVTDQGLRLKALASFKNDDTTYFLAELTDETGDRLAKDTQLFSWEMLNGGNSRVVDYDKPSKTATILTKAIRTDDNASTGYQLKSFLSHEKNFKENISINLAEHLSKDAEWLDISKQGAQGGGYDEEQAKKVGLKWEEVTKTALKPDVLNIPLATTGLTISNLAYKDNLLHLQLKGPNTVQNNTHFVSLIDKDTGKERTNLADYQIDNGTHSNETGRSAYTEYVFNISEKELANADIQVEGWTNETYQKGNWAIQLEEPKALPTKKISDITLTNNEATTQLKNIVLSPLSISFDYLRKELENTDLTIEIFVKGKKEKVLDISDVPSYEGAAEEDRYTYEFGYLELDGVEKVLVNGEEVSFSS